MRTRYVLPALALTMTVAVSACGSDTKTKAAPATDTTTITSEAPTTTTVLTSAISASDLRALLEFQLQEHVYLAGMAPAKP